jgi:hypothetical protein
MATALYYTGDVPTLDPLPPTTAAATYGIFLKRDFGAVGDGTADDTAKVKAWRDAWTPGKILYAEVGKYKLTDEILFTQPGVIVVGLGHQGNGPGQPQDSMGTQFRQTTPGKWCFVRAGAATGNEMRGGQFVNLGFRDWTGNGSAAGGMLVRSGHNIIDNCNANCFWGGPGFEVRGPVGGDSAPLNRFVNCGAHDCMPGYYANPSFGAVYTQFTNCNAMKYVSGGKKHQGQGYRISADACSIFGGHCESHAVGILVDAAHGAYIAGTTFEDNATYDIDLYRPAGVDGTRNLVQVRTSKIRVGPFQVKDMVIGGNYQGPILNQGTGTVVLGNY